MLKIITGRISSSKTHIIVEEIGKRNEKRKKSILIVPDQVTYNFEQRLCAQLNILGFIDVEVCSFNRLASSIIDFFGKNKKTYLDKSTKAMALRHCIISCRDKLTIFKSAAEKKGFSALAIKMISTLENCGYTVDDLKNTIEKLNDGILKYKLSDMAVIYEEFSKILQLGYTDNADKLKTAEELLPLYQQIKDSVIFIDGFDVFTTSLYNLIGGLMEQTDVVIAVSSADEQEDNSAYEIHQITLDNLINIAKERNIPYTVEHVYKKTDTKSKEIHFIEDNFYKTSKKTFDEKVKNISLEYYASPYEEIDAVARKIIDEIKKGNRFKDFAVLSGDIKKYSPIVNTIFNRYDIPVHTDKKFDISSHPVSLYLFSLLKCAYSGFSPENVIDIALSSLSDLTKNEKEIFVSFIKEMGVKGYEIENGLYFDRGDKEKQAEFDFIRKNFIAPIKDFRENILNTKNAKEMALVCYEFLEKQGVYEKTQELVDTYEKLGFFELSDVTAQIWNKTQQLLEDIAQLLKNKEITVQEFALTLHEGFVALEASTIPSVLDCVTFGDLTSAKEQDIPYVFIVGANDGVIPANYTDERIVTVSESALLRELGLELAHSVETEDARIRYNLYSALCTPKKRLEISCPLFTENGAPLRPSIIFKRFLDLFTHLKINNNPMLLPKDKLKTPYSIDDTLFNMACDKISSEESKTLFEYFENKQNFKFDILKQEQKDRELVIPKNLALNLFVPKNYTSISKLETFASCPYKHFIEYGLKPEKAKEYCTDALDIGTTIHNILETFTKNNAINDLTKKDCYDITASLFDEIAPNVHFGAMFSSDRQKAFNKVLKTLTGETAWKIKEHLDNFEIIGEEISFGYGKYPPIEISTEYGTLYIKGKIDRADRLEKDGKVYLRIVDYKSGKKEFKKDNVQDGTDLQLMIYMNALLSQYKNSSPASAQYMLIENDNEFSGPVVNSFSDSKKSVSEEEFNELLFCAKETAQNLTDNMLSGNIMPKESKKCEYCEFSGICGIKAINEEE